MDYNKVEYKGIRYRYFFDGLNGTIYRNNDDREIAFLQFPDDILYLENQLESIKENQNFSYEEIVDLVLDAYDY